MRLQTAATLIGVAAVALLSRAGRNVSAEPMPVAGKVTQGALMIRGEGAVKLECPLRHTDVKADITGFLARVTVTQDFENTAPDKVEAVYVFPLPHNAAVDDMTLQVGSRTVKGLIKKREEAQAIYDAARNAGKVAALLDQERPNIFTQSVANVAPGAKVRITISYVERLAYEAGTYEFVFPMVVGPRYIPVKAAPGDKQIGGGWKWDTDRVPDAARISPPVARPDQRAGHDISLEVKLDAGVPVDAPTCNSHEVATERKGDREAMVRLKDKDSIPNKDFVLRYDVAGRKIADTVLTHRDARGGYFTLILQPPDRLITHEITPKEIVFVLDTSGSMSGFPIEKAKESMRLAMDALNARDTFNLITFAGETSILFPQPVPATPENLSRARQSLSGRHGSGGTEMMKAVRAALEGSGSQKNVRIVCFMTDGYVGNEEEIIAEVQKHPNARVFSFGIGSSVNRYLLDKMAEVGRGEVEYVSLKDDGSAAARRFEERVRNPLLTDISVEWNGLPVADVLPARVPDLFSAKPLVLTGRYTAAGKGTIRLRGKVAGSPVTREIPVDLPASEPRHEVLAALWARTKIDSLMHAPDQQNKDEITRLGLDYRLMTPYTSFVAVEETVITEGGKPRRVQVPVEIPEGVSYEGVFGSEGVQGVRQVGFAPAIARMGKSSSAIAWRQLEAPAVVGGVIGGVPRDESFLPAVVPPDRRKLDPALRQLSGAQKIQVQIFLTSTDSATLDALRKLGVEILAQPQSAKMVIARVSADWLQALAKLSAVTWIAPLVAK